MIGFKLCTRGVVELKVVLAVKVAFKLRVISVDKAIFKLADDS